MIKKIFLIYYDREVKPQAHQPLNQTEKSVGATKQHLMVSNSTEIGNLFKIKNFNGEAHHLWLRDCSTPIS